MTCSPRFLLLGVGLSVGFSLAACQSRPSASSTAASPAPSPERPSPVANPRQSGQPFPNQVVQNFMAGCTGAKVTESACKCTITRLQQTYSYDEFSQINQAMGQGTPAPKSFAEIVAACKQA